MPRYQVIRNVDIVSFVEADTEEGAIEAALEAECAGDSEFQENYTEAHIISKRSKKV